jgi:hypothetical protein
MTVLYQKLIRKSDANVRIIEETSIVSTLDNVIKKRRN